PRAGCPVRCVRSCRWPCEKAGQYSVALTSTRFVRTFAPYGDLSYTRLMRRIAVVLALGGLLALGRGAFGGTATAVSALRRPPAPSAHAEDCCRPRARGPAHARRRRVRWDGDVLEPGNRSR